MPTATPANAHGHSTGHHHLILSNPFATVNADSDDGDNSSFDSSAPHTPTIAQPAGGLRAQLTHLLPRHAFFHVLIVVHQITNIPLVTGEFALQWKFKNVHSAPGAKGGTGLLGNLKARRKARQDERNAKGKARAGDDDLDDGDDTVSLASNEAASQRGPSIDGRSASLWSGQSSSSSSSSSSSHRGTSRTAVNSSTASSPSLTSTTTSSTTSTVPSLPASLLAAPTLASSPPATTPARGQTHFRKLKEHNVSWEYTLSILIRMDVDRDPQSMLLSCPVKLTILQRDPANLDARPTRFGIVNLDLAQYACKGEVTRRYLLRESKTNATLKLTTHLAHLPTTSAPTPSTPPTPSITTSSTSSTTTTSTSTSTNTFTAPPLPQGEILNGISNILSGPSGLGIIGEHDVYRVRPKGLDLYGPYYDQEELELDLLGGPATPSSKSKSKGKLKAIKPADNDLEQQGRRNGRERSATQSFDPSRLPLAYGPKTTETLIEALFNPVHTSHQAKESPFTVYIPPEPRPTLLANRTVPKMPSPSTPVSFIDASSRSVSAPTPTLGSLGSSTATLTATAVLPPSLSSKALSSSRVTSSPSAPAPSLTPTPKANANANSRSATPSEAGRPLPPRRSGSTGIGAGLGIMGLGMGLGVGMGVGVGVSNGNGEAGGRMSLESSNVGVGRASLESGHGGEGGKARRSVDGGQREREGKRRTSIDVEAEREQELGGKAGGVKGWWRKKSGVGTGAGLVPVAALAR
ncbi:hypothetical protein D9615_003471 [Tricholomella constricta]|uniref:C2 NT-type domain-containing protein n=1 Tax=Tricholomella constricta TaxID=117010 RepID=A0A8H5M881_9AGAR|nr:hypothetical protein D9615_003471 [Tricholomella constricta]